MDLGVILCNSLMLLKKHTGSVELEDFFFSLILQRCKEEDSWFNLHSALNLKENEQLVYQGRIYDLLRATAESHQ